LQFARYRALNNGTHVPFQELSRFGRADLQADPRIRQLYTQSAGMAHFLMDFDNGRYRQEVLQLLGCIYSGQGIEENVRDLEARAGTLDQEYLDEFLPVTDEDLKALVASREISQLVLGHCPITETGLKLVGDRRVDGLWWLDLTACRAEESALAWLKNASNLRQLSLEATRVTNVTLETIGQLPKLEELDLSSTSISDDGLKELSRLSKLRVLHLTKTRISDRGLKHLAGLASLAQLEVSETQVSDQGIADLKLSNPQLTVDSSSGGP
jgi:hypothetical protein